MNLPKYCKYCGSKLLELLPNMRIRCFACLAIYDDPGEDVDWKEFYRELQKSKDSALEKAMMDVWKNL